MLVEITRLRNELQKQNLNEAQMKGLIHQLTLAEQKAIDAGDDVKKIFYYLLISIYYSYNTSQIQKMKQSLGF